MTAANKINYYKMNIGYTGRSTNSAEIIARAIGADNADIAAIYERFGVLAKSKTPTIVEISGFESEYSSHKFLIDVFFKYLKHFQKKYKLVKFAVRIGNMRYFI